MTIEGKMLCYAYKKNNACVYCDGGIDVITSDKKFTELNWDMYYKLTADTESEKLPNDVWTPMSFDTSKPGMHIVNLVYERDEVLYTTSRIIYVLDSNTTMRDAQLNIKSNKVTYKLGEMLNKDDYIVDYNFHIIQPSEWQYLGFNTREIGEKKLTILHDAGNGTIIKGTISYTVV